MTWDEVKNHPVFDRNGDHYRSQYGTYARVCDEEPYVLDNLPEKIDVLVLDGGNFSSEAEFHKLQARSKVIMLDDTHAVIKNYHSHRWLEQSDE